MDQCHYSPVKTEGSIAVLRGEILGLPADHCSKNFDFLKTGVEIKDTNSIFMYCVGVF